MSSLMQNRDDGTGWEWCWADWQRDWMDTTPQPIRLSLPAAHDRQSDGPVDQKPGRIHRNLARAESPGSIDFQFDQSADVWMRWISNDFGAGIVTWNTPFLFRTKPAGSRLLVCGPANYFLDNAHPLTAIIESDWMTMSFTMNWKLMRPGHPVRFEVGEPYFRQCRSSATSVWTRRASITYRKLDDDPEIPGRTGSGTGRAVGS